MTPAFRARSHGRQLLAAVAFTALVVLPPAARAQANITFTGITPLTNINGTTIQGVTFTTADGLLIVGAAGPGCQPLVCDPSAIGETLNQVLTLDFAQPVSTLSFGTALSVMSGTPNFFIQLINASNGIIGNFGVATGLDGGNFVEGEFTYAGGQTVRSARITFQQGGANQFAIDNIRTSVTATPEPASAALLATGLGGIGGIVRRKRRAQRTT
jgi:hypothetical protein